DARWRFNAKSTIRFRLANISAPPRNIESIRPLLTKHTKNLIEVVRGSYLPRPNSKPERMRRGRENFLHLAHSGGSAGIVKNRDTGNFENDFFEQLQTLPA